MQNKEQEPIRLPKNRDKLIARAIAADDSCVSVGGLAAHIGLLHGADEVAEAGGRASTEALGLQTLARLIQLARREYGLTPEQFASKHRLDLRELLDIEDV